MIRLEGTRAAPQWKKLRRILTALTRKKAIRSFDCDFESGSHSWCKSSRLTTDESSTTTCSTRVCHRLINPRTSRHNGKRERSHRVDAEEFYCRLDKTLIDDHKVFNNQLEEWENFFNYSRPDCGLGGQTP